MKATCFSAACKVGFVCCTRTKLLAWHGMASSTSGGVASVKSCLASECKGYIFSHVTKKDSMWGRTFWVPPERAGVAVQGFYFTARDEGANAAIFFSISATRVYALSERPRYSCYVCPESEEETEEDYIFRSLRIEENITPFSCQ